MDEFKEDKKYVVTVTHSFTGKFKRFVQDPLTKAQIAVFETGGSGRQGMYERAVQTNHIVASELTKTDG